MGSHPQGLFPIITSNLVSIPTLIAHIHDRMPVIISPNNFEQWLDPSQGKEALLSLLAPYPKKEMEAYPVALTIKKPDIDGPELIRQLRAD